MEDVEDHLGSQEIAEATPAHDVFSPPSIKNRLVLSGESYTHMSAVPNTLITEPDTECVLGVDEAGRGPVLGMHD